MRKNILRILSVSTIILFPIVIFAHTISDTSRKAEILKQAYSIQVPFIENIGQIESKEVSFYVKILGGTIFIEKDGVLTYNLPAKDKKSVVINEIFTNKSIKPEGSEPSSTRVNYFIGNEKRNWKINIATYNSISLMDIYKGIDVRLEAHGNNIEKFFYIRPNANPENIKIKIDGANGLSVNEKGQLEIETGSEILKFTAPIAYQEKDGKKKNIKIAYSVTDNEYGFKVGPYDKNRVLIIDPLLASTYLGGANREYPWDISLDTSGNVYIAGYTKSAGFPISVGAYNQTINGARDVFVSKLDRNLENLLASTFIGGSTYIDEGDYAQSIFVDDNGNVYVAGMTDSEDFPVIDGCYDTNYNGGVDGFISKLDNNLQNLLSSTFIGGNNNDIMLFALSSSNESIYLTGYTESSNFPVTPGSYDTTYNTDSLNAFISKFDNNLQNLQASTFGIGGLSLAIDNNRDVFVAGYVVSEDIAATGYDKTYNGEGDVFVAKIAPNLSYKGPWTRKTEGSTNRADHSCVVYNDKMYIFGGGCDSRENFDDLWEYNIIEDRWSSKGNAPVKRAPSGVVYNGKMYIFGGAGDDIAPTEEAKELWAYDFMSEMWEKKTSGPYGLSLHTAVVYNEKMYVFGGEIANSGQESDELWEYDFANDTWSLKSTASRPFLHHSAVFYNDKMYVFGGIFPGPDSCDPNNNDINSYQLWEYDFNTNNWNHICDAPFSRSEHTAVVHNGEMYIFGGGTFYLDQFCEGCLVESNALWKYNFSKNSWLQIENIGSWPNSRAGHSVVIYNHKMYIFGGGIFRDFSDPDCFNDLWEYDFEFYVRFADYFPTDSEKYGIKPFEWTFGKTGQFTRRIEGTETVSYKSGDITGAKITNYFDSDIGIVFNDGENVKFLGTGDYYLSTDCNSPDHPSEFSFNTFYDGMIIDQREYYSINKDNASDCQMDGNQMLLISIQDVTVLGGDYENAVIIWWLDKNYPFIDSNFHGKDLDLGITLPTSSDTNGYSVTAFDVFGFETGPIAVADISASTGDLVQLSELTDEIVIEMNLPKGWSMVSLPVIPNSTAVSSLFPEAEIAYGYEKDEGYVRVTKLDVGDGYWILLDQNQTYTLIGQPIQSYSKMVNKPTGKDYVWDMIGGCSYMALPTGESCKIVVIYRYVQGLGYVRVPGSKLLKPGEGYWILLEDIADQAELTVYAPNMI